MKKYDVNTLDQKVEKIVSKTVKYYYTDWKNYDRIKYVKLRIDPAVDNIKLIVRKCGTYIFSDNEIQTKESAKTILEYYTTQEPANVYDINTTNGSVKLVYKGIA